jgi:SpoVK/Ycf46/Vps4 family AAA+-type ATPase/ribosome biogenesis GTPase A
MTLNNSTESMALLLEQIAILIGEVSSHSVTLSSDSSVQPGLDMLVDAQAVQSLGKSLTDGLVSLVVAGGFNNGKSTLINALLMSSVVITGSTPTTAVVTRLVAGDKLHVRVHRHGYSPEEIEWNDYVETYTVAAATHGRAKPDFRHVELIEIELPFRLLEPGISIIDTPGLAENRHRTTLALQYLPHASAIIVVIDAIHPLSTEERAFINLLGTDALTNTFFVVNRIDLVHDNDLVAFKAWMSEKIEHYFTDSQGQVNSALMRQRLFFTNAQEAADGLTGEGIDSDKDASSGIAELRNTLKDYLQTSARGKAKLRAALPMLLDIVYRANLVAEARQAALSKPLEQMKSELERTSERVRKMHTAIDAIQQRIRDLGYTVSYQVYTDLLQYIAELEGLWAQDVQLLELDSLADTNIFTAIYNQKQKEEFASVLSNEVERYIERKLIQWAKRLPEKLHANIQRLLEDTERDLSLFQVEVSQMANWLNNRRSTTQQLGLVKSIDSSIFSSVFKTENIFQFTRPLIDNLMDGWKQDGTLGMVALTAVQQVLAIGSRVLTGGGLPGVVLSLFVSIGASTIAQMIQRREFDRIRQQGNQQQLHEAFADLDTKQIQNLQKVVRSLLTDQVRTSLFAQIRARVISQRDHLHSQFNEEFALLSEQIAAGLRAEVDDVLAVQKRLLRQRESSQFSLKQEEHRLTTVQTAIRERVDRICEITVDRTFTNDEIALLSQRRAIFLERSAELPEVIPVPIVDVPIVHEVETDASQPTTLPQELINRRLVEMVHSAMGLDAASGNPAADIDEIATLSTELAQMIGLSGVKSRILEMMDTQAEMQERRRQGLKMGGPPSLHLVFTGNPGTGKTTVAELIGKMYRKLGLLTGGKVIVAKRETIVGDHIGATERNMREFIKKAQGNVLFIDEAYTLVKKDSPWDFGKNALETLLDAMERHLNNFAVIVAGYPKLMQEFLQSNPGLMSRFPQSNIIHFPDYAPEELLQILTSILAASDFMLSDVAQHKALQVIRGMYAQRGSTFGNARDMRNFAQDMIDKHSARRRKLKSTSDSTILPEDISGVYDIYLVPEITNSSVDEALTKLNSMVGLTNVKATIQGWVARAKLDQRLGKTHKNQVMHMIFQGPQGTGKTTVAQLMGVILHALGYLPTPTVLTKTRDDFTGEFQGHTEKNVRAILDEAVDKVLFIDEAYSLHMSGATNDIGKIVIDMLTAYMEHPDYGKRMVVILAGYPDQLDEMFRSNPGLRGRFRPPFEFKAYTPDELLEIVRNMGATEGYSFSPELEVRVSQYLERVRENDPEQFSNARAVREMLNAMIENCYVRVAALQIEDNAELARLLRQFVIEDVPPLPELVRKKSRTPRSIVAQLPEVIKDADENSSGIVMTTSLTEISPLTIKIIPPAAERSR